jgi:hypothetical protein
VTWQTKAWRTPSARQERIDNENQGMSEWCFQCGVAQRPQRAVGWDEDGEPACSGHAKRATNPLKLDRPAEAQVAETLVSVHSYPGQFVNEEEKEEAAAPSPVQTSAKEIVMGGNEKQCQCGCGTVFTATGNRQLYAPGHKPAPKKKARIKAPTPKARKSAVQVYDRALNNLTDAIVGTGSTETVFGPNRFTASQLDRLWVLLSPASKAEALDHLLGSKV